MVSDIKSVPTSARVQLVKGDVYCIYMHVPVAQIYDGFGPGPNADADGCCHRLLNINAPDF